MQKNLKNFSRSLRRNASDAEKKLWKHLRQKQIQGLKFRRQAPVDKFIADFLCYERRLIIELDGGQHAEQLDYDGNRTRILEACGFRVLRFWNNDVLQNIEGVLLEIIGAVNPHPYPPPQGEGEDGNLSHAP